MSRSIFIIEDEGLIALMLQKFLSSQNFSISGIAKEGLKAIEMIQVLNPDLVVMDVNIQGDMNGVETFKKIRGFSNIPIIFLTGNTVEIITDEEACKGVPIFEKPISLSDLKKMIDKMLG